MVEMLNEDDLLDLIEGKKVGGLKVSKETKKSIKFAMKRGDKIEDIKKKYLLNIKSSVTEKPMNKK